MPDTIKQYEKDAFLRTCAATLQQLRQENGHPQLALNTTILFPEGGGQPADRGTLHFAAGLCRVLNVHEQDGVIWHTVDSLPADAVPGAPVQCQLDWAWRFDKMQQHSGEHILSGTLHRLYGAENVGFHIGESIVRMDTDIPLTPEQLLRAETEANAVIWDDVPVAVSYPTQEQLSHMVYRSKKEIAGQVRIVAIPGADVCACCGTHVRSTGQVGLIKILAADHYKGGERLTVVCGARALREAQAMRARQADIGALLSAKSDQTAVATHRLYNEYTALKFAHYSMAGRLFDALAADVVPGQPCFVLVPGLTPDELHRCAQTLCARTSALCAVLSSTEAGLGYCVAQVDGDVRPLTKALNAQFTGRGGGKPGLCQGSCPAEAEAVLAWLKAQTQSL